MNLEIECVRCGVGIDHESEGEELNTTVDCECGARYAVTISLLRG